MIAFLRGTLLTVEGNSVILEVNKIGFKLQVSASTLDKLPEPGLEVKLFTCLIYRDNAFAIYGFYNQEELNIFRILLNVDGVGPKAALGLLSALDLETLYMAIFQEKINVLLKAPGIGKKTAQRIILELKDKLIKEKKFLNNLDDNYIYNEKDAIAGLIALGYSKSEAKKAVQAASRHLGSDLETSQLIRYALQQLDKDLV